MSCVASARKQASRQARQRTTTTITTPGKKAGKKTGKTTECTPKDQVARRRPSTHFRPACAEASSKAVLFHPLQAASLAKTWLCVVLRMVRDGQGALPSRIGRLPGSHEVCAVAASPGKVLQPIFGRLVWMPHPPKAMSFKAFHDLQ